MPIDNPQQSKRKVPMRVLCFGFPRTGTLSAQKALLRLGYEECYHYFQWIEHPDHSTAWKRAYEAKYLNKAPFTRNDWDEILGDYEAVTDNPCVYFAPELIAAYPETKVILQTRDLNSWYDSFHNTILKFCRDPIFYYLCDLDSGMKQWWPVSLKLHYAAFEGNLQRENAIAVHQKSMERVRGMVPRETLLEWKVQDGWGPLCTFLGVTEPGEEFPRVNESKRFSEMMEVISRGLVWKAVKAGMTWVGAFVAVGVGIWWVMRN